VQPGRETASLAEALAEICVMDAPLGERLEAYVAAQRAFGSPFAAASDSLAARLAEGEVGLGSPAKGERMPDFLLPDRRGRLVALAELAESGPVVLSFNRGHWCPFCRIELTALAAIHSDLVGLGAKVVSIMPDRQSYVGRLPPEITGRLEILTDIDNAYCVSIGLVFWVGDELMGLMRAHGLDLGEVHGNASWCVPLPATYVIAPDRRIVARRVEPDFRRRMEPAAIVQAVRDLAS
jgi:peroxiredoxin